MGEAKAAEAAMVMAMAKGRASTPNCRAASVAIGNTSAAAAAFERNSVKIRVAKYTMASTPTGPSPVPTSTSTEAIPPAAPVFSKALLTPKAAAMRTSTDISTEPRTSPTDRQPNTTTAEAASKEVVIIGSVSVVTTAIRAIKIKSAGTALWYRGGALSGTSETT